MSQANAILTEDRRVFSILFVDDEKNILSSLNRLFHKSGYKILLAQSAKDGLQILTKEPVDLVVSDMNMPNMDGVTFLEKVAKHWPETVRILLTGHADLEATIKAINNGNIARYIKKPWEDIDFQIVIENALKTKQLKEEHQLLLALTQKQNKELSRLNAGLENEVEKRTSELKKALEELKSANDKQKEYYITLIRLFSNVIGMRDVNSKGRNRRVADFSQQIAVKMGVTGDMLQSVLIAGLLHGIGKMGLSDEIINKPYNKMSKEEVAEFKNYPVYGEQLLTGLEPMKEVADIIRHQLERYDGYGTPDNLSADDIPIGARILAVTVGIELAREEAIHNVDSPLGYILDVLEKEKGKKYDAEVVDQCITILKTQTDVVHLS